jgi:Cyclic nucleotide-binding domain
MEGYMHFNFFDVFHLDVIELLRSHLNIASLMAFIGALFYLPSYYMKTIVPLRVAGIIGNFFFLAYGYMYPSYPTFFLYLFILPINMFRLYQMWDLINQVKLSTQGDLSMEWLKPFMTTRSYKKGDVLFHKGDLAGEMFYVISGAYLITEIGLTLRTGQVLGELGFLAPDNRRTQTIECTEDGQMLTITYDKVRELYFQNPTFGFYFLRLTSERLMQNIARLDAALAQKHSATSTPVAS